jgi:hypothetical protein
LRVQTVLYVNDQTQVWRLLFGLAGAAQRVVAEGRVSAVEWALGDCSPAARLASADVAALREAGLANGLADLTYEFFDDNLGSSGGHNRLAAGHDTELLMTLNPDTYPSPRMLDQLVAALDDPTVAISEARQIPMEHPKAYAPSGDTSWASTCAVVIRRSVFDEVGGFDHEHFPLYCDDVDFSWRVRLAGHRVVVAPGAVVFHDKRPAAHGRPQASDVEVYHSTLGRLMLATRFDRPDIVDATVDWVIKAGPPAQRDALADYRAAADAGRLPTPEPDAARVAQFLDGEYAVHRF